MRDDTRLLIDTNVLVYAEDPRDPRKQAIASRILRTLGGPACAGLTTQVLGEYWRAVTGGRDPLLARVEATRRVRDFGVVAPVLGIDLATTLEAARLASERSLSYRDAQLVATAMVNDICLVLSEDFSDGVEIEGVRILDPFAPHFDVESVLS
jgi:predicted nucleic acid-binding protein